VRRNGKKENLCRQRGCDEKTIQRKPTETYLTKHFEWTREHPRLDSEEEIGKRSWEITGDRYA